MTSKVSLVIRSYTDCNLTVQVTGGRSTAQNRLTAGVDPLNAKILIEVVEIAKDFECDVSNAKDFAFRDIEYKIYCSGIGSRLLRQAAGMFLTTVGGRHVLSP